MVVRFNWGTGIALVYVAFAAGTLAFVVFAMTQTVDLVSPDYYAQSLRQNERMEAVRNAQALGALPAIVQTDGRRVLLTLGAGQAESARGTVTLYRASDARADRVLPLALDAAGRQEIPLEGMPAGHWTLKLDWTAGGRSYYVEQAVLAR
jgi:nitrogen fixation protein FixH